MPYWLRVLLRLSGGVFCVLVLTAVCAGLLDVRARWRFGQIASSNPYVLREQHLTPEFSEAFSDDLWRQKWYAYEPGKSLSTQVDGERFEVAINSRGFRSREVEIPKPAG